MSAQMTDAEWEAHIQRIHADRLVETVSVSIRAEEADRA